jgi:hypothetical protein
VFFVNSFLITYLSLNEVHFDHTLVISVYLYLFVVYLQTLSAIQIIWCRVMCWLMNYNGYVSCIYLEGRSKTTKTSVRIVGLRAEENYSKAQKKSEHK